MSWHLHIFDKLAKVWRHLSFPDDGWEEWKGSRRDQCTLIAIEEKRARPSSRASETTLLHWAACIDDHVLAPDNREARAWLQEVEEKHRAASAADRRALVLSPSGEVLTVADVLAVLQTGMLGRAFRGAPAFNGRPMKLGAWIWYQLLRDAYSMREFDAFFHFSGGTLGAQHTEAPTASAPHAEASDTLQVVQKVWRPDLRVDSHAQAQWPGHYILYRVDQDAFERSLKSPQTRWSGDPYGWLGAQRVLRVPVSVGWNEDLLTYHDVFPDPADGLYEMRGLLAQIFDGTVDLFGYDAFTRNESGRFLATLLRTRRDDARGVIFAREKVDKIVSCYRVWLHKVDADEDYHDLRAEVRRVDSMFRSHSSAEAKWREYRQNAILFQSVAQLLAEGRYAMIHYLFAPPAIKESDLAKRRKVQGIKPFPVSHVVFTASLRPPSMNAVGSQP